MNNKRIILLPLALLCAIAAMFAQTAYPGQTQKQAQPQAQLQKPKQQNTLPDPPATEDEYQRQYQERIKKERLNGIYIPKNLEDACAQLTKLSSPEAREKLRKLPADSVVAFMHAKLGQWIIINWSFYEGSRLSNYLSSAGVTYPDDMADFIVTAWHLQLNEKPIDIKDLVTRFKEKRKKQWETEKKTKVQEGTVIFEEKRKKDPPKTTSKER